MTVSVNYKFSQFLRVVIVFIGFVGALIFTRIGLAPELKYRQCVGISPYQPPNWVFRAMWGFLYLTYAVAWVYAIHILHQKDATTPDGISKMSYLDNLFVFGVFVNFGWAAVIAASATGAIHPHFAHILSMFLLLILGIFSAGIAVYYWRVLALKYKASYAKVLTLPFVIYTLWMIAAIFLSLTSAKLPCV